MSELTSTKPHLLRAFYDWMLENALTPYVLVRADSDDVLVPREYVKDDQITLNLAGSAVKSLELENSYVAFNARFSGVAQNVYIPISNVMAIFAKENGYGINFESINDFGNAITGESEARSNTNSELGKTDKSAEKSGPNLRLV